MIRRRFVVVAVCLLLAVHASLLACSAMRHSPTVLEPALLASGLSHWRFGRFEFYRVNPPLVRMVAALPVIAAGYEGDWSAFYEAPGARPEFLMGTDFIVANGERSLWLFTIARWACIPFSLAGGLFAFFYARELWQSDLSGLLAVTLWCFEPNILGNAELITNDAACTAFGIGATWLYWRWLKQPTWTRAAWAGILLGLAELAKMSWLMLFGLWPLLWLFWQVFHKPASSNRLGFRLPCLEGFCQLGLILLLALYLINFGYAFDGTFTRLKEFDFISASLTGLETSGEVGNRFRNSWLADLPVPLPKQYVLGFDTQKYDFESWNRPNFLRGEWKRGEGWWYYYLYGLWVKVPHGVQILVGLSILVPVWSGWRSSRQTGSRPGCYDSEPGSFTSHAPLSKSLGPNPSLLDQIVLLAPGLVLFTLVSSQTKMNEHFRYVLPMIATFLVYVGRLAPLVRPCPDRLS